ncbi:MAG: hypothetical protein WD471_01365 [Candidatus Paceibacterota bacterium]
MKLVLIGGYPKGFDEPFHIKTTSGRILRKIVDEVELDPIYFDLWSNKKEEDSRVISNKTKKKLKEFESKGYTLVSLGRYIEKVLLDNKIKSHYLPHPASRDKKYVDLLREGLRSKRK